MWQHIRAVGVLLPGRQAGRRILVSALGSALLGAAFWVGFLCADLNKSEQVVGHSASNPIEVLRASYKKPSLPVAYIHGSHAVTRQDLGEYLIERVGAQRVELLINRKLIHLECARRNITVSDNEVEAQLISDLKAMNVPSVDYFVKNILRRANKSLFEYKEDELRPRLALRKLCEQIVKVTDADVRKEFESRYGPKVQCRMILFTKDQKESDVLKIWEKVRNDEAEFAHAARNQNIPGLRANGGVVSPVYRHFPDKKVERVAFSLKLGEVSEIITMPDKSRAIFKCDDIIPPQPRNLADVRRQLERVVLERKILEMRPKLLKSLRRRARPKVLLKKETFDKTTAHKINQKLRKNLMNRYGKPDATPPNPRPKPPTSLPLPPSNLKNKTNSGKTGAMPPPPNSGKTGAMPPPPNRDKTGATPLPNTGSLPKFDPLGGIMVPAVSPLNSSAAGTGPGVKLLPPANNGKK